MEGGNFKTSKSKVKNLSNHQKCRNVHRTIGAKFLCQTFIVGSNVPLNVEPHE